MGFVAVKSGLKRDAFDLNGAHEVALSFGGLLLFVPGLWGTASVTLSPFWVPVLLLAVQYGTMTGLAAAVAATAVSLTLGEEPPLEDYYAHFLNLWRNPMLWLAAVLGRRDQRQGTRSCAGRCGRSRQLAAGRHFQSWRKAGHRRV